MCFWFEIGEPENARSNLSSRMTLPPQNVSLSELL
jgi:hypothetical protein